MVSYSCSPTLLLTMTVLIVRNSAKTDKLFQGRFLGLDISLFPRNFPKSGLKFEDG